MRDVETVIQALIRKANDRAVTAEERDALLAKAAELRDAHPEPERAAEPMPIVDLFNVASGTATGTVDGMTVTMSWSVRSTTHD